MEGGRGEGRRREGHEQEPRDGQEPESPERLSVLGCAPLCVYKVRLRHVPEVPGKLDGTPGREGMVGVSV